VFWLIFTSALAADPALDLPALAEREGLPAVATALEALQATSKNSKKRDAVLASSGLDTLQVPVHAILGAELTVSTFTPLSGCTFDGSALTCRFGGTAAGAIEAGEYTATCRSKYGATQALDISLIAADDTRAAWQATHVERCFAMGVAKITVQPTSHDELQGVGEGTEFIPPELTGLTWQQVEKTILKTVPSFRICMQGDKGGARAGQIVIAFTIGEDGTLSRVEAESSQIQDPATEACILERFGRITFPPPMDGFTDGTFPFTLQ
jgi:hypothetical protein